MVQREPVSEQSLEGEKRRVIQAHCRLRGKLWETRLGRWAGSCLSRDLKYQATEFVFISGSSGEPVETFEQETDSFEDLVLGKTSRGWRPMNRDLEKGNGAK